MNANGRGVDAPLENRPGVPMEKVPPSPVGAAPWASPDLQEPRVEVLVHAQRAELTPVFGTGQPPRGLSGVLRRVAYKIPDHRVKHWMLLLLADRIDVQQNRIVRVARSPLTWVIGGVAAVGAVAYAIRQRV